MTKHKPVLTDEEMRAVVQNAGLAWTAPDAQIIRATEQAILAKQAAQVEPVAWLPIETAPKDGTHFLAVELGGGRFGYFERGQQDAADVVHWFEDGFYSSTFGGDQQKPFTHFTHWKPYDQDQSTYTTPPASSALVEAAEKALEIGDHLLAIFRHPTRSVSYLDGDRLEQSNNALRAALEAENDAHLKLTIPPEKGHTDHDCAVTVNKLRDIAKEFHASGQLRERIAQVVRPLFEELQIDDNLLSERSRVLKAIPACKAHGSECVPHAIEWIQAQLSRQCTPADKANGPIGTLTKAYELGLEAIRFCAGKPQDERTTRKLNRALDAMCNAMPVLDLIPADAVDVSELNDLKPSYKALMPGAEEDPK